MKIVSEIVLKIVIQVDSLNLFKCSQQKKNLFSFKNIPKIYIKFTEQALLKSFSFNGRLTTCSILKCEVRLADETLYWTIECPVLTQMIDQSCILILKKFSNECA
jgi:hypothetical protein